MAVRGIVATWVAVVMAKEANTGKMALKYLKRILNWFEYRDTQWTVTFFLVGFALPPFSSLLYSYFMYFTLCVLALFFIVLPFPVSPSYLINTMAWLSFISFFVFPLARNFEIINSKQKRNKGIGWIIFFKKKKRKQMSSCALFFDFSLLFPAVQIVVS